MTLSVLSSLERMWWAFREPVYVVFICFLIIFCRGLFYIEKKLLQGLVKIFLSLTLRIVEWVSEYVFFVLIKNTYPYKQKAKRNWRKNKKEKEKEIFFINNICRKSNGIRWYRLTICVVYFFNLCDQPTKRQCVEKTINFGKYSYIFAYFIFKVEAKMG